jgi:mannose-6-phosphate isomerase
MGAHEGDPSRLPDRRALDGVIRDDPEAMLGPRVRETFGDRLPFLMKVLAAAEPLSLQVHPSAARAQIGFAHEEAAGIPRDAPHRNYRDTSHKPEMVYALTRFEGMAGFRDVEETAHLLGRLELPWADEIAQSLQVGSPFQALRGVVSDLLAMEGDRLAELLQSISRAAVQAEARGHRSEALTRPRSARRNKIDREAIRVFALVPRLVDRYPTDPGVLVMLLLNHVVLAPGEAMYLGAGVIHAYTSGLGVEIMASSDNVLRAGLTSKHTDVPELLRVASFNPIPGPRWDPSRLDDTSELLEPPVDEFRLTVGRPPLVDVPATGPRIVLVLDEQVEVRAASETIHASRGAALFVPHDAGKIAIHGPGRVAIGSVPA